MRIEVKKVIEQEKKAKENSKPFLGLSCFLVDLDGLENLNSGANRGLVCYTFPHVDHSNHIFNIKFGGELLLRLNFIMC
jgi:hypothetical protein